MNTADSGKHRVFQQQLAFAQAKFTLVKRKAKVYPVVSY